MNRKVLIVDDAAFMRLMIKNILIGEGYEIAGEASNGEEAVEKFLELKPDLVTMDITMPKMDGLAAVHKIRELDKNARIIMCSALGQQNKVIEAVEAGAKDFVVKPFKPARVLDAIDRAFK